MTDHTAQLSLESRLVNFGVGRDERTGGISFPIYPSATYRHPGVGESTGYDYTRSGNPTRQLLEEVFAQLEGGSGLPVTGIDHPLQFAALGGE